MHRAKSSLLGNPQQQATAVTISLQGGQQHSQYLPISPAFDTPVRSFSPPPFHTRSSVPQFLQYSSASFVKSPDRTRKVLLPMLAVVILAACHTKSAAPANNAAEATHVWQNNVVTVPEASELRHFLVLGKATLRSVQTELLAPAVLEADPSKVANILPPLSGRIAHLYVHLGDNVRAGQPLFTIDSSDLAQARADLKHAQQSLVFFKKALVRAEDLAAHNNIISAKDLEQAQTDYAGAQAELERAQAVFSTFGIPLNTNESPRQLTVKSPVSGRVSTLSAVAGTFANDNTAALMTVSDVSTLWFTASVQEKDLATVKAGEEVEATVQAFPGETFKGRVAFVADQLDADTRTIKVRIAYQNADGRLRPNMFATVRFLGVARDVVVVPTAALLQNDANVQVFVQTAPWAFTARTLTIGARSGEFTEVLTGLAAGTDIVVKNGVLLND